MKSSSQSVKESTERHANCNSYVKKDICLRNMDHRKDHPHASTELTLQLHTSSTKALVNGVAVAHDDISGSSQTNSGAGLSVSPYDVVSIGHDKPCSEMRTAMIHQQRIFKSQVFELHRLIAVQKTLARSPCMLLEKKCKMKKPTPSNENLEDSMKTIKEQSNQWWLSPQGSHWLVPVVSPSEGLVYKPLGLPAFENNSFGHGVKECEVQRRREAVLSLFPTEPADRQRKCLPLTPIRAVPHTPRSASQSAARIFSFIMEGEKPSEQYDD